MLTLGHTIRKQRAGIGTEALTPKLIPANSTIKLLTKIPGWELKKKVINIFTVHGILFANYIYIY